MMDLLEIVEVSKLFGDPPKPALTDVSLNVEPGSITVVVGASGSGKSTLLRVVGGLTEPSSGKVVMGGRTPRDLRTAKAVGWMAQRPALLPWHTVIDNISLAQSINHQPDRPVPSPADLLELIGLADSAHTFPNQLSGGMQQRVALARTLAIGAPLWLMDEPFSSLDELTRERLTRDLLDLWRSVRPTVVWVTHHIPEAVTLADQIAVLTPRPGRMAGLIGVDIPRPRDPTSPQFQEVVRDVRAVLREAETTPS